MAFLYNQHLQGIKYFVLNNSGTEEAALDVLQDALVVLYLNIRKGQFDHRGSLKAYIHAVAKNLWLKELRRQRTNLQVISQQESAQFETEMRLHEKQLSIRKILDKIDKDCKKLLMDFYFEKKTVKILTKEFGLGSEGATKNKKYRCLQKLREIVKQHKFLRSDFEDE